MKYDIYKQLTEQQKDEWIFKYKDNELPYHYSFLWAIIIYAFVTTMLAIVLVILKEYIDIQLDVILLLSNTLMITKYMMIASLLSYVTGFVFYFIKKYKETKWLKSLQLK